MPRDIDYDNIAEPVRKYLPPLFVHNGCFQRKWWKSGDFFPWSWNFRTSTASKNFAHNRWSFSFTNRSLKINDWLRNFQNERHHSHDLSKEMKSRLPPSTRHPAIKTKQAENFNERSCSSKARAYLLLASTNETFHFDVFETRYSNPECLQLFGIR